MDENKKIIKKSDIFYHIVKGWRIIFLFTLIGLVTGVSIIGFSYIRGEMTREYKISTSCVLIAENAKGLYTQDTKEPYKSDIDFARTLTDSAKYIIKSQRNMQAVVDSLGLQNVSASSISRNLSISQYNETEILEFTLLWGTEKEGLQIMQAIIDVSHKTMIETMRIGGLSVVNEPKAGFIVGGNISLSTWIYAALIGLIAGVAFCILRFIFATTVINEIDLEEVFGLDSLGSVPLDVKYAKAKPFSPEEDEVEDDIKSIAHLLINRLEIANVNKFYITSTMHNEGKTRLIADIALQFSLLGKKTLLIDCCFKNPKLGALCTEDLTHEQTINALYRGDSDKIDAIVHINGCLDLLAAELEEKPESFNDAMLAQLAAVMESYDYVMIDAAPIGLDAEVLRLNEITDAAVFVIRCDYTKVEDIKKALFKLGKSDIPIAGGIFNCLVNWKQTILNTPKHLASALKREAKKLKKEEAKKNKEKKSRAKKVKGEEQ